MKITTVVTGVRSFSQARKTMNEATRVNVRGAVQVTTEAVAARSRLNVPISTPRDRKAKSRPGPGELRDSIRTAYTLDGMVGFVMAGFGKLPRRSRVAKATKLGPMRFAAYQRHQKRLALKAQREIGVYAMVINYGSPGTGIAATHYMDRARDSERQPHVSRIQRALVVAADATNRAAAS